MLAISACWYSRLAWEDRLFKASTPLCRQTFCTHTLLYCCDIHWQHFPRAVFCQWSNAADRRAEDSPLMAAGAIHSTCAESQLPRGTLACGLDLIECRDVMYLFLDAAAVRRGPSQAVQGHVRAGAPSHTSETTGDQATG